jgi:hypothetical protein
MGSDLYLNPPKEDPIPIWEQVRNLELTVESLRKGKHDADKACKEYLREIVQLKKAIRLLKEA